MTLVLQLQLERADDPIAGIVHGSDGSSRPFTGWLELAAAIDELRLLRDTAATSTGSSATRAG